MIGKSQWSRQEGGRRKGRHSTAETQLRDRIINELEEVSQMCQYISMGHGIYELFTEGVPSRCPSSPMAAFTLRARSCATVHKYHLRDRGFHEHPQEKSGQTDRWIESGLQNASLIN